MAEVHVNLHNIRNCVCGKCPSFPGRWKELEHAQMPGLFCAAGKSKLEIDQQGCLCSGCDVFKEHELKDGYFCVNGKAS